VIYQLVVRHFGNENLSRIKDGTLEQNGVGKFADINEAAAAMLVQSGVTHVWLTGVLRQATMTDWSSVDPGLGADDPDIVKGRAGSFYAIRDYFDVCPDYAVDPANRMVEFEALVERLHQAGLKVMLDLVPNHVARSYGSVVKPELDFGKGDDTSAFFSPQNSYFYLTQPQGKPLKLRRPAGWNPPGIVFDGLFDREDGAPGRPPRVTGNNVLSAEPSENDWYETIKLNFGFNFADPASSSFDPRPPVWDRMDAILAYWQARGVDGFRCDFAHFVPLQAWSWLIAQAKQRDPQALVIAEAYENLEGLLSSGFDAVYNDPAYDLLKEIYQGKRTLDDLDGMLRDLGNGQRHRYLHYLENHDERRIASPVVLQGGADSSGFGSTRAGRQLAPLLYLGTSGPVLVYNGQEVGEDGSGEEGFGGDDGKTTLFDYWALPGLAALHNGGAWDGGKLSPAQTSLRAYYRDLLALVQDPAVRGEGYWGLRYANGQAPGMFPLARFAPGAGRLLLVVANFQPGSSLQSTVKLPAELLGAAGLSAGGTARLVLDEGGAQQKELGSFSAQELSGGGIPVNVPDQAAHVLLLTAP
jgi:glycosidase